MNKTEKIICIILGAALAWYLFSEKHYAAHPEVIEYYTGIDRNNSVLLQIVDTSLPSIAATRPDTALALWGRARPAGHPAARIAA